MLLILLFSLPSGVFIALDPPVVTASEPAARIEQRVEHARRQQQRISQWLKLRGVEHRRYWLANRIYIPKPTAGLLQELEAAGYRVEPEEVIRLEPIRPEKAEPGAGIQPGVVFVKAPELWSMGLKGHGSVVATIDTGIYPSHPDLKSAWTGIWRDPANVCGKAGPCDNNGHGTHVAGTILGRNGIGVAPEASLIACKGCESSWCSASSLLDCAQWLVDLVRSGQRIDAVNNSWGGGQSDWFRQAVDAWIEAGIFPVVAAGNSGPYCGTVGSPGNYRTSFTVGAVDASTSLIASFSSRGPGDTVKPDVVAPGVQVLSAWIDGGYMKLSGTSMATPHVSGIVALLKPLGYGNAKIAEALRQSSAEKPDSSCGGEGRSNNVYGWGYVDALSAYQYLRKSPPPPPPPDEPPVIRILEPVNGQVYVCGELIRAKAVASDAEDGDLSDRITWWSIYPFWRGPSAELIGPVARGCELGWHRIEAEVEDSAGNVARSSVWVLVRSKP